MQIFFFFLICQILSLTQYVDQHQNRNDTFVFAYRVRKSGMRSHDIVPDEGQ